MQELFVGPLFSELVRNMDDVVNGYVNVKGSKSNSDTNTKPKRAYEYSTGDSVLLTLLPTLQMYNHISPPYGATLLIELHKNPADVMGNAGHKEYFIRVRFPVFKITQFSRLA